MDQAEYERIIGVLGSGLSPETQPLTLMLEPWMADWFGERLALALREYTKDGTQQVRGSSAWWRVYPHGWPDAWASACVSGSTPKGVHE